MLLAAFDARRPTADVDALARGFANDEATVVARVVAVAANAVPDDGVEFRPQSVTSRVAKTSTPECASRWTARSPRPSSNSDLM